MTAPIPQVRAGPEEPGDDEDEDDEGNLRALDRAVAAGLPQVVDRATRLHLEDVRDRVAHTLDPAWTADQEGGRGVAGFTELDGLVNPWQLLGAEYHEACWRDHGITLDRP